MYLWVSALARFCTPALMSRHSRAVYIWTTGVFVNKRNLCTTWLKDLRYPQVRHLYLSLALSLALLCALLSEVEGYSGTPNWPTEFWWAFGQPTLHSVSAELALLLIGHRFVLVATVLKRRHSLRGQGVVYFHVLSGSVWLFVGMFKHFFS